MKINKDQIMLGWISLVLAVVLVIYGCRSLPTETTMPAEPAPAPITIVDSEDVSHIQPPEDAASMPHEMTGFEDCASCHYAGGTDESATTVEKEHYCSACHDMAQPLHFDHGAPPNESCPLCHRPE